MSGSIFEVKSGAFEGPLELLLDLIEQRKLHISDISLAEVADGYIGHVKELETFPIRNAAQFVLIASTLLLIKSKSLLPTIDLTIEEQEDIHELEQRLVLYKRMKELSRHIEKRFGRDMIFARLDVSNQDPVFTPGKEITLKNLLESAKTLIRNFPKVEKLSKTIVEKVMSLEEMIEHLTERVQKKVSMGFKEFAQKNDAQTEREVKLNFVVSFLALLELVKQGVIAVEQNKAFDDIEMATNTMSTPDYS